MVKITVLMAVRDTPAAMLRQAIESIRGQTLREFEFLILDDGTERAETCAELEQQAAADARIRLERGPRRGLTATLNRGLALAAGEFVARQDADDWSELERLELQVEYFQAHPETAVLGTNAWTHQQDGRPLWRLHLPTEHAGILRRLARGNPFVHGSVMFPKAAAVAAGGYREEFRCSQDYDFLWRLAECGGAANLAAALYHYRYSSGSVSASRAAEQASAHRAIQRLGAARRRGEPEDVVNARADAQGASAPGALAALLKQADHLMLAGDYRQAWTVYSKLLRSHPENPRAWAKLARLGVFRMIPRLREACFR